MGDWFIRAFGGAVADVREKLVEEAWFGRCFGNRTADPDTGGTAKTASDHFGWERGPAPGQDFDR